MKKKIFLMFVLLFVAIGLIACGGKTFTVKFSSDGEIVKTLDEVKQGSKISAPSDVTKDGYTLNGWYKEANHTTEWKFEEDTVEGDITLYAKWDENTVIPEKFAVKFYDGDNELKALAQLVEKGSLINEIDGPLKEGYTFKAWYKEKGLTNLWDFSKDKVNQEVNLYAKYELDVIPPVEHTVTFDSNEGSAVSPINVVEGLSAAKPENPTKAGFVFGGWYSDEGLKDFYFFDYNKITEDITLYARWLDSATSVAINSEEELQALLTGDSACDASKTYYLTKDLNFEGFEDDENLKWVTNNSREFTAVLDGNGYKVSKIVTNSESKEGIVGRVKGGTVRNIIFDSISVASTKERSGIVASELTNSPNTSVFSNIIILDSSVSANKNEGAGAILGQAKYNVEIYNVAIINVNINNTLKSSGGLIGQADGEARGIKVSIKNVQVDAVLTASDNVGGLIGETKNTTDFEIDGVSLNVELSGVKYMASVLGRSQQTATASSIKNVVGVVNIIGTGTSADICDLVAGNDVAFTVSNTYIVALATNFALKKAKQSTELLGSLSDLDEAKLSGFASLWNKEGLGLPRLFNQDYSEYFTIIFKDGDNAIGLQYVKSGRLMVKPVNPVKEDHKFNGWYLGEEEYVAAPVTENFELSANFLPLVIVSFDPKMEGVTAPADKEVVKGETLTAPKKPNDVRGYTFDKWYKDPELQVEFVFETDTVGETTILYGGWAETYVVVFMVGEFEYSWANVAKDGLSKVSKPTGTVQEGYDVVWMLAGNEYSFDNVVESNLELVAALEAIDVTITFDANGGYYDVETVTSKDIIGKYDGVIDPLDVEEPTRDLYDFAGWAVSANEGAEEFSFEEPLKGDATVYAIWELKDDVLKYTVTFDFNYEGSTPVDVEVIQGSALDIDLLPVASRSGFTFLGWFESEDAGVTLAATAYDFDTIIPDNMTLYADWEAVTVSGTPITTPAELVLATKDSSVTAEYYLANDIDLTGFTWTYSSSSTFAGILDGNGKKIIGFTLTAAGTGDKAGLFYALAEATIKNITFVNASVTSGNRAGVIAGEIVDNANSTANKTIIQNVRFENCTVVGAADNGTGFIAGMIKQTPVDIMNVSAIGGSLTNAAQNSGALIGQVDGNKVAGTLVTVSDIYVDGVTVKAKNRSGALFGECKNSAVITIDRVVVVDTTMDAVENIGGIIGNDNVADDNNTVANTFLNVSIVNTAGGTTKNVGHTSGNKTLKITNDSVFVVESSFAITPNKQTVIAANVIPEISTIDAAWWLANLPTISETNGWILVEGIYVLQ